MRESKIEKAVVDHARKLGVLTYKFVSPANRGVPDRVFIGAGETVYIEFKATGQAPTKLQQKIHRDFLFVGVEVYIIDDIKQGTDLIDALFT